MVGTAQYPERTAQFLALVAQGLTRAEIRDRLDITSSQYDGMARRMKASRERAA